MRFLSFALVLCACARSSAPKGQVERADPAPVVRSTRVGPTPWKPWEHWRVTRPARPDLDVFVAHDEQRKPLVVMLQGSGCDPLFAISGDARSQMRASTLIFGNLIGERLGRAHFVAIEKRGVVSFGPIRDRTQPPPPCSPDYEAGVSKRDRVADVVAVIEALAREAWAGPVLVVGHSEGGEVASGVARVLGKRLEAVGIFSSAGPSQLVDSITYAHREGTVVAVRDAFAEIQHVLDPATQAWRGHSSARWRSYAVESTGLDDMRASEVPTFVAHGTRDASSPVESADTFVVELMRSDLRRPVFYLRIHDADHGLDMPDGQRQVALAFERFLDWGLASTKPRGVLVGPPF